MSAAAALVRVRDRWRGLKERLAPAQDDRPDWFRSAPFLALHAALLLIPWLGFGTREALAFGGTYVVGMFAITAGYHRCFSHRAFRTSRWFRFVLAFLAEATFQKGVLWWSSQHRHHHRWSDRDEDVHSPLRSFWWSHVGWVLCNRANAVRGELVRDLARDPEIRWIDRWYLLPPLCVGSAFFAAGGLALLVGGYVLGVVVLFHATAAINSLAHLWGTRRYATSDGSRNNLLLALLTFGEGWHNNHHHRPASARQGVRWWEIDLTWYALRLLAAVGVVWDLRGGPTPRPRPGVSVPLRARAPETVRGAAAGRRSP